MTLGDYHARYFYQSLEGLQQLANLPIKKLVFVDSMPDGNQSIDLSPISGFKTLESLHLESIKADDLTPLLSLKNLQELYLDTSVKQPFQTLYQIKGLQKVTLSGGRINSLLGIEKMPQLQYVDLENTGISNYDLLMNAPQLKGLGINEVKENIGFLSALKNLESLVLITSKPLSIKNEWLKMPNLRKLSLFGISLDGYNFMNDTPNLEQLTIKRTNLPEPLFHEVTSPLTKLTNLSLYADKLKTIAGAERFSSLFPSLQSLDLSQNEIKDLSNLVNTDTPFSQLKDINLFENKIIDVNTLGVHANLFPNLAHLDIGTNYVFSVKDLALLPALTAVESSYNFIDDTNRENPKAFSQGAQYTLIPPKPYTMRIGEGSEPDYVEEAGLWTKTLNPDDLIVTSSDPSVVEVVDGVNLYAKKQGTAKITYSILGSKSPYLSLSFDMDVSSDIYKPYPVSPYHNVTDQSKQLQGRGNIGDTIKVGINGKIVGIQSLTKSPFFAIELPNLKGVKEIELWSVSRDGVSSDVSKIPVSRLTPPAQPTIDPISDQTLYVTGKAEPNTEIHLKTDDPNYHLLDNTTIFVKADGTFKAHIGKQLPGIKIYFTVIDRASGAESKPTIMTVEDKTPPETPVINNVTSESTYITGNTEARASVLLYKQSKYFATAVADKAGHFKQKISKPAPGTIFTAKAKDKAGNISKSVKKVALDKTPPPAPMVNRVSSKSIYLTGKAEAYSTVIVKVNSKQIGSTKADRKGNFKVKTKKQKRGTIYMVYAKDRAGNIGKAKKVKSY
ncbi:Ig-like domain-containing protein [Margalitia sp. FSL K6-0131]|uniref:Ig-like domain-containing protein n=1 Tax=Margalitia sp. FSL K6-0131 TaxID=2954604 RepID=UPI0030F4DC55